MKKGLKLLSCQFTVGIGHELKKLFLMSLSILLRNSLKEFL